MKKTEVSGQFVQQNKKEQQKEEKMKIKMQNSSDGILGGWEKYRKQG